MFTLEILKHFWYSMQIICLKYSTIMPGHINMYKPRFQKSQSFLLKSAKQNQVQKMRCSAKITSITVTVIKRRSDCSKERGPLKYQTESTQSRVTQNWTKTLMKRGFQAINRWRLSCIYGIYRVSPQKSDSSILVSIQKQYDIIKLFLHTLLTKCLFT